jgi:4a-hydroxytetrahydrobiopterin dehydratase
MKRFTSILESSDKYYKILVELELILKANNEGEASYLSDSIVSSIKGQSDFKIKSVEEETTNLQAKFENMNTSDWSVINGKLQKIFTLDDFQKAIYFVNKIAKLAEEENHHPEINIDHNTVIVRLFTKDQNKVSELDEQMSNKINKLL